MEHTIPLIIIPAAIALLFKAGIYAYAHFSRVSNAQTRIYLLFLFSLSLQNISEIFGLYKLNVEHIIPYTEATLFYGVSIFIIALMYQLALTLAFDRIDGIKRIALVSVYLYACVLAVLLTFTPLLILDYQVLNYGFGLSPTRVPGPLFFLFEIYAICILGATLGTLIYGSIKQSAAQKRVKNSIVLAAIVPMVVVVPVILTLLHFGIRWINASVVFPSCITYFLIVTAYATYHHRIFDIQFFIPWSKVRKRKNAFYDRIRATITEIADLASVNQVVNRLADTLHCPVALIGGQKPAMVLAGESFGMARFPLKELQKIEHITIANEVAEAQPDIYALMRRHKVAAIIPYHPLSQAAASWMLLGEHFSEEVYTPLDFRVVEELFARLGDLFLDKLLLMRAQLNDAQREMRELHHRLANAWEELESTRKENQKLRVQNAQLLRQHANTVGLSVLNSTTDDDAPTLSAEPPIVMEEKTLDDYVAEFEAKIIEQVLKRCDGNKAQAARLLGLRPNTLHYKIERYGLDGKIGKE